MRKLLQRATVGLVAVIAGCAAEAKNEGLRAQPPDAALEAMAEIETHHLMRLADVHEGQIVFTYENDLWVVSSDGGLARRLTNDPGAEIWAKFSPCGKWIAFTAQYDGGVDVYVMDARGGVPRRLTYHPAYDRVVGWWPDGESVVFRSNRVWPFRGEEVYRAFVDGGMPERLPVDRAGLATISPDGEMIAYNRITRESRTWKRHRGGTAQDIWMGSLEQMDYRKIIDTDWSDNFPMWHGDAIYFNSDREDGTLNLYKYEVKGGNVKRLTCYTDYDVKYPSIGPSHIIYQYAETLHLLDLMTGETRMVPVKIPTDLIRMRPEYVSVSPRTGSFRLSPTGVRVLLEARGEILNLPADEGDPINLTESSGSREKNAAWSPDGRWIAFISDRTGEEEVYLVDQKGKKPWKQLTQGGLGFRMHLVWSPDSEHLLFADKFMRLNLVDAETGEITVIDQGDYDDAWERWGIQDYVWSPCSQWVAYTKMEQSLYDSIFLYSLESGESCRLTSNLTEDWSPSFSPDGKYLYFLSNRTFDPVMCFADQNHIFLEMGKPYVMLLHADAESPFVPEDSEEEVEEEPAVEEEEEEEEEAEATEEDEEEDAEHEEEAAEEAQPEEAEEGPTVDLDGIMRRILVAEGVPAGNYFRLEASKKGFLYLKKDRREFSKYQVVTDDTGGRLDLYHYDLGKKKTTKVLDGIANYHQSADGKKLVYRSGSTYGVVDVGRKAKVGDGKVSLSGVRVKVDRPDEFRQAFSEAWRIQRDWFYDLGMHGVDWEAMRGKYGRFVPFCGNRSDLNYLIGEMIAELNIGHTYVGGGDIRSDAKRVSTALLGMELATDDGAKYYRISHIVPGTPGDPGARSPLDEPGCPIGVGDYLIAIDGEEVTTADNPYEFLQHKADRIVALTYNDKPSPDDAETYRLKTVGSERTIRYREWVEKNRAYVERLTDGRVGYVHIPNMGEAGLIEFAKVWYPHYYKKAFIVDERYNGGGFTADMIIDRLERELWALTQPREGKPLRDPERCFHGPWVVLINEDSGSNGEFFAEAIKIKELAPVIGMRTWGGSIGIEPHQDLVDGGGVTPPQFGLYGLDGRWLIEGHGVEPDIEVQNMPGDVLRGQDAQLDAAIEYVLKELKKHPVELPGPPEYPDKSRPAGS
jgi:tricorn protease